MFNFYYTFKWLRWQRSTEPPPALPECITRMFVTTPSGDLEILYAAPVGPDVRAGTPPLFFAHGGMGGGWVWIEYLQYFSSRGIPCYAVSLRGHGQSWHPSYLRMVFATTKRALADDLVAGVRWAQEREGAEVVLVGHSSGGGLSQLILSEGKVQAKGLALVAAIPGFGSMGVYINWWRQDPLFNIRMLLHGGHPNSPLSHPALTKSVFFSDRVSEKYLLGFQRQINAYESLLWPLGMMKPFVNTASLVQHLGGRSGWVSGGQRIMILAGGGDKLMTVPIMRQLATTYRANVGKLAETKKVDDGADSFEALEGEGDLDNVGHWVRFCVVPEAGHHLQNDVQWEVGARKLLEFYRQL